MVIVLTGLFHSGLRLFGFNPAARWRFRAFGASVPCRRTMLAGCTAQFGAVLFMWIKYGKPESSNGGYGLWQVSSHHPPSATSTRWGDHHRLRRRLNWCASASNSLTAFCARMIRGAISVNGTNGIWGSSRRPVCRWHQTRSRDCLRGPTQLVAQLIGVATLLACFSPVLPRTWRFTSHRDSDLRRRMNSKAGLPEKELCATLGGY